MAIYDAITQGRQEGIKLAEQDWQRKEKAEARDYNTRALDSLNTQRDIQNKQEAKKMNLQSLKDLSNLIEKVSNIDSDAAQQMLNGEFFQNLYKNAGGGNIEFKIDPKFDRSVSYISINEKSIQAYMQHTGETREEAGESLKNKNQLMVENIIYKDGRPTETNITGWLGKELKEEKTKGPTLKQIEKTAQATSILKSIDNVFAFMDDLPDNMWGTTLLRLSNLMPGGGFANKWKKMHNDSNYITQHLGRRLTGAAMPDHEVKAFDKMFGITMVDNESTIKYKLNRSKELLNMELAIYADKEAWHAFLDSEQTNIDNAEKERTSWINTKEKKLNKMSSDNKPTSDFSWITGKGG